MNDTAREYLSYGKFILPFCRFRRTIRPTERRWGDTHQYFLYFPGAQPRKDQAVIYIHGGGWNSQSPKLSFYIGQRIAEAGYDCFLPGYRKTPKHRYDDIADDVFNGYREIRKFMAEKGLSYVKEVVMGSSAGAHLGAILCFDRERQARFGIDGEDFDALLTMAGPLRFDLPQTGILDWLLGQLFGTKDKNVWKKGEPYGMLCPKPDFRLFMIQSPHDGLVGWDQAKSYCDRAAELGIPAEFYAVDEAWNTHSAYCAGVFLKNRGESATLEKVFDMLSRV